MINKKKFIKLLYIIIMIFTICLNTTTSLAATATEEPTQKEYTFNEESNYDIKGYNIITITQAILQIIGVVALIIGLGKFILGKTNNDDPEVMAGALLIAIGFALTIATTILINLNILVKT